MLGKVVNHIKKRCLLYRVVQINSGWIKKLNEKSQVLKFGGKKNLSKGKNFLGEKSYKL